MNLQEAIIKYFKDNRLIKNNEKGCDVPSYLFDINEDTLKKNTGIVLPKSESKYKKNIDLKFALHKKRKNAKSDKERKKLVEYYISDWGGIKGNKPATLNEYSKKTANELILKKTDGISSWSKALVLSDPNKYAIYDARVAISINCLQLINKKNFKKVLFPLLIGKSRMSIIQKNAIDKQIKEIAKNENWECLDKATFYEEYLHILKTTNQALRKENIKTHGISTIEMLLFAETEELIKKAIKKNLLKELP